MLEKTTEVMEKESMDVIISDDFMEAKVKFYAPVESKERLTVEEIIKFIRENKVTGTLDVEVLQQVFAHREYGEEYIVAKGKEPIHGKDAYIEWTFDIEELSKPILHEEEDGHVDFKNIDTFKKVVKGEVLARKTPVTIGEDGIDVRGIKIRHRQGKDKALPVGKGTVINTEDNTLVAERDGQLLDKNGKLIVSEVLHINGNVGPETGNIKFFKTVKITGNVLGGFSVVAGGDVIVEGTVENAVIESEGSVYIKGGFQGRNEGKITCKGEMISKFIQDATVEAGGNVETESANYSDIKTKGSIIVTKGKGNITGGEYSALDKIEARKIGSRMGVKTTVKIDSSYTLVKGHQEQIEERESYTKAIKQLEEAIFKSITEGGGDTQKSGVISTALEQKEKLEEAVEKLDEEIRQSGELIKKGFEEKVICREEVFEGTEVTINNHLKRFVYDKKSCTIEIRNGEISLISI